MEQKKDIMLRVCTSEMRQESENRVRVNGNATEKHIRLRVSTSEMRQESENRVRVNGNGTEK